MSESIVGQTLNSAYHELCQKLVSQGKREMGRQQGAIFALHDVELVINNPRATVLTLPYRNMSRTYAAGEFCLYLEGTDDVEDFAYYSKSWRKLAKEGGFVNSAYGERWFSEISGERLKFCIQQLVDNPETKNAIVMVRDQRDIEPGLKDRCCTLFHHFWIEDGKTLHMRTCMRSSDIWLGLPYDVFAFTRLFQFVLYSVNKKSGKTYKMGTYIHQMLNVHAYPKQYSKIAEGLQSRHWVFDTSKAYEFPEYTDAVHERMEAFLAWEKNMRKTNDKFTSAIVLRDGKFPPFLETLGSWLLTKTDNIVPTEEMSRLFSEAYDKAKWSECIDRKVGCVLTDDENRICGKGFNHVINCNQNCNDKLKRVCNVRHAEISALHDAKARGVVPKHAYVTLFPCLPCRRALEDAGVTDIYVHGFVHKGAYGTSIVHCIDPEWEV